MNVCSKTISNGLFVVICHIRPILTLDNLFYSSPAFPSSPQEASCAGRSKKTSITCPKISYANAS